MSASRISTAKNVPASGALYTPARPAAAVIATSIRVSFASRCAQRANRWPNIAPNSRGATSRPIDMPVPTMKICSSTCTTVCQIGIISPFTAFLTDGTFVLRVRNSHQITAAMAAPAVTEISRRITGTLNGPDSCEFST